MFLERVGIFWEFSKRPKSVLFIITTSKLYALSVLQLFKDDEYAWGHVGPYQPFTTQNLGEEIDFFGLYTQMTEYSLSDDAHPKRVVTCKPGPVRSELTEGDSVSGIVNFSIGQTQNFTLEEKKHNFFLDPVFDIFHFFQCVFLEISPKEEKPEFWIDTLYNREKNCNIFSRATLVFSDEVIEFSSTGKAYLKFRRVQHRLKLKTFHCKNCQSPNNCLQIKT